MELRRVRQTSLTYSKERGSRVRVYRRVCARLTRLADKSLHVSKSWHFEQVESKGNRFRTLAKAAGRAGTGSPRGTARPRVPALSRADLAIPKPHVARHLFAWRLSVPRWQVLASAEKERTYRVQRFARTWHRMTHPVISCPVE